jgi:hypothetical protein
MKNSSRLLLKMALNFACSSSGVCSLSACDNTRWLKATQLSSRLM